MRNSARNTVFTLLMVYPASMAAAQQPSRELDFSLPSNPAAGSFRSAQEQGLSLEYNSTPIGKRKRWRLDSGRFGDEPLAEKLRPGGDPLDSYSGIRLRRPLGGKK